MVRSPPASAGDKGFGPWARKAPHATEQLSLRAATTEPIHLGPVLPSGEATAMRSLRTTREWPLRADTREKPVQLGRPSTVKGKLMN